MKRVTIVTMLTAACAAVLISTATVPAADAPAASSSAAPKSTDYALAKSRELEPSRIVIYKKVGDRELQLRTFLPEGWKPEDRRPCFLAVHGGGWVAGTPNVMFCVTDYLARRGWVAVSMQYRLHKPDAGTTVFDSVKDGRSAVRYLRSHADELGIDAQKIVAGGRSAGGHIAVATALFDGIDDPQDPSNVSCVPNALVLFSPVIDTSADGYGKELIGDRWRELSPLHQVRPGLPPTIVFHGKRDTTTPFAGAKAFHEQMLRAGNRCELVASERGSHSYMMRTAELFDDAMSRTMGFLRANGIQDPDNAKPTGK